MTDVDDFLAHYGVKGMKWGRRKSRNENYSDNQVRRDQEVYGMRGSRRINKALNKGNSIGTARAVEKTRRDNVMAKNPYHRQVGKIVGAGVGIIGVNVGISAAKRAANSPKVLGFVGNLLKNAPPGVKGAAANTFVGARTVTSLLSTPQFRLIASSGAAAIGQKLSGDIAVSANMRVHGYNPNRK